MIDRVILTISINQIRNYLMLAIFASDVQRVITFQILGVLNERLRQCHFYILPLTLFIYLDLIWIIS